MGDFVSGFLTWVGYAFIVGSLSSAVFSNVSLMFLFCLSAKIGIMWFSILRASAQCSFDGNRIRWVR